MSLRRIDKLFNFKKGTLQSSRCEPGDYAFITASAEWKTHKKFSSDCEALVFAAAASGSLGRTHYVNGKFIASDLCFILTPKDHVNFPVDLKFYHIIFNKLRTDVVKNTKAGTSKEAIGLKSFGRYQLPYFDIERQINIKNQFASSAETSERLTTELDGQLDLVKQLRQAFLREAVQGKLVEQDPKDEPASELFKKIKNALRQARPERSRRAQGDKKVKRQKELAPIKEEELLFDIPDKWVWCRLGELCDLITSGSRGWAKYYSNQGAIFIRMGNLARGNFLLRMGKIQYVNPPTNSEGDRTKLEENDILISITGEVGNLGLIPKNFGEAYINQHTALVRLNAVISAKFIAYSFLSNFLQEQFNAPQRGMKNSFRLSDIEYLIIPLPPLPEQRRIVAKLEQLMRLCDGLEQSIRQSKEHTDMLLQAALREALQPKAGVIKLPVLQEAEERAQFKRAVLAAYLINQSLDDPNFGNTKFEKLLHLSEYHALKRNFNQNYLQQAAGPYDNKFTYWFWGHIEKQRWFRRKQQGLQFIFMPGTEHEKSTNLYNYFSPEELGRVEKLIQYFKNTNYEDPEIASTLYAVWNNRIIQQQETNDELLIADFYAWDESKKKYDRVRLEKALQWMHKEGLVPNGWGKVVSKVKKENNRGGAQCRLKDLRK